MAEDTDVLGSLNWFQGYAAQCASQQSTAGRDPDRLHHRAKFSKAGGADGIADKKRAAREAGPYERSLSAKLPHFCGDKFQCLNEGVNIL
jgi:hypothetical protein